MKRIAYLLVVSLAAVSSCVAQVWNKTYVEDRPVMLFSSILQMDSSFKVIGLAADKVTPSYARALAANIDWNGTMTKYIVQTDSSAVNFGVFYSTLIKTFQNDFAFTGYVFDSLPHLLFARFDPNLDSMRIYMYDTTNSYVFNGNALLQYDSNSFFIAGIKTDNTPVNAHLVLLKIDSNGNKIWQKYYDQFKLDEARSVIRLSNGNLMLGAFRDDLNTTIEHANTWLIEVDAGGGDSAAVA